jgi:thiol-disulfide isomerase/thioredoxin
MRFRLFLMLLAAGLSTTLLLAQTETTEAPTADETALSGIAQLMPKTRQGGDSPSEDDFKARREAGLEIAAKAKQFLKDFPASKHAEDGQVLWNIGLFQAAVAGDSGAAGELKTRAGEIIKDPKLADSVKLQTFSMNFIAEWAKKKGLRNLNQSSAEFQKVSMDALFEAANFLSDKDSIFKMMLLQAKAAPSPEEKTALAQRVLDHPAASASIKASAKKIISGEPEYAIGKPLDLSFVAVDGRKVNLADMKGKVVLIDFWATWCGPCVYEMPTVKKAYDKYHAAGFEVVGISLDTDKEALLQFIKKNGMAWPQYFDGKQWGNDISFRFGINGVPAEWLVDKKGVLRDTEARGQVDESVKALLDEK